ncbi:MAG: acyltransferase [Deltaproteobacteria bacterium]|nr:acyltransferase [Deltaproteobacteria bacterium]
MKAGFLQTAPVFGAVERNVEDAVKGLLALSKRGAELVVLPELFSTGYAFRDKRESLKYSERVSDGYAVRRLAETAKVTGMFIAAGFVERDGKRVYNSSVLVGPKGVIAVYRKTHLFWNEKKYFYPGDTGFKVHDIGKAKVGMMICFDWVFPEAARTLALMGADVILHPSNLVLPFCPEAMITRCLENRVYAITANRVGSEKRGAAKALTFIGQSEVVSPRGRVMKRASAKKAESALVEIDPRAARSKCVTPLNDIFKDRVKKFYKF